MTSCLKVIEGDIWRALGIVPALNWATMGSFCSGLGFLMNRVTKKNFVFLLMADSS